MTRDVERYKYGYKDDGNGNRHLGLIKDPEGRLVLFDDYQRDIAAATQKTVEGTMTLLTNHVYEVDLSSTPSEYWTHYKNLGLTDKSHVVVLGEITNMPGHFMLANKDGRIIWGLHPEMFKWIDDV